jgi:hypothetical protein
LTPRGRREATHPRPNPATRPPGIPPSHRDGPCPTAAPILPPCSRRAPPRRPQTSHSRQRNRLTSAAPIPSTSVSVGPVRLEIGEKVLCCWGSQSKATPARKAFSGEEDIASAEPAEHGAAAQGRGAPRPGGPLEGPTHADVDLAQGGATRSAATWRRATSAGSRRCTAWRSRIRSRAKHDLHPGSGRRRGRPWTKPGPAAPAISDPVGRRFDPDHVDVTWVGDMSDILTAEGWLCLATVVDLASRRLLGSLHELHLGCRTVRRRPRGRRRRPAAPLHGPGGLLLRPARRTPGRRFRASARASAWPSP